MKNFTILIFCIFFSIISRGQTPIFNSLSQYGVGSSEIDAAQSCVYDSDQNIIVYGSFRAPMYFESSGNGPNITNLGTPDLFLAKYDPSGTLIWVFNLGRISLNNGMDASGVAVDLDNNIIISGSFSNTVNFNPAGTAALKTSAGGKDAFLAKYDQNGELIWVNTYGSLFFDFGCDVTIDSDNAIFFGLRYNGNVNVNPNGTDVVLNPQSGATDAALVKYNSSGEYMWHFEISTPKNDNITSIEVSQSGLVAIGSSVNGSLTGVPESDMHLFLLNADGSLSWDYNFNNYSNSNAISCFYFADNDQSLYVAGRIQGDTDFDPDPNNTLVIQPLFADPFFAKYDLTNHSLIWAKYIESAGIEDYVAGIIETGSALIALGSFDNQAFFSPGDFTSEILSQGGQDIYIAAFDKISGNFIEAQAFGGSGNEFARSAYFNPVGNILVAGSFSNSLSVDPNVPAIDSEGFTDIFFAEFSYLTNLSADKLTPNAAGAVSLYPVPAGNTIAMDIPGYSGGDATIGIISIVGKLEKEIHINHTSELKNIDVSYLKPGIYILDIKINGSRVSKRMVKI